MHSDPNIINSRLPAEVNGNTMHSVRWRVVEGGAMFAVNKVTECSSLESRTFIVHY